MSNNSERKGSLLGEFRRMSGNRMAKLSLAGLAVIPLLYSGMLIGAFWDPYGKLGDLPVAVVNEDAGATMDGKAIHVGADLVEELGKKDTFKWSFTNASEAMEGLEDHRYAMAFVIPGDFSSKTATLKEDNPQPAGISYYVDDGWNYLSSRIGDSASETLRADVSKEVTKAYAAAVLDSVGSAAEGLKEASDGASKLADGAKEAQDGAEKLHANLAKLADGTLQLNQGLGKLTGGAATLATGAREAASASGTLAGGLGKLSGAGKSLSDGAAASGQGAASVAAGAEKLSGSGQTLATGAADAKSGSVSVSAGADQLAAGLKQYADAHSDLASDPAFQKLLGAATQVAEGAGKLKQGTAALAAGAEQLADGQRTLSQGAAQLNGGLQQLNTGLSSYLGKVDEASAGADKLAAGIKQLSSGAEQLRNGLGDADSGVRTVTDGASKLTDGSEQLAGGIKKLGDGSSELSGKLGEASKDANALKGGDKTTEMFAEPVSINEHKLANIANYGTGMTPYFLSLGLYVGIMMSTIILPLRDSSGAVSRSGWRWYLSKLALFAPVVLLQSILADTLLLYVMGLEVPNVPLFYAASALIALTFMTILQFLVSLADTIGRFIGVILLTLQLAASAGTYPTELLPAWLQAISPWMPMTHAIEALRLLIAGAPASKLAEPLLILAAFAVLFIALTFGYFHLASKRKGEAFAAAATA
ncbi:YhgE/Pip family protein [Cohnella faecalis]|nr:YhgE/Pip domain-containing protein [Cohnella faecalis]